MESHDALQNTSAALTFLLRSGSLYTRKQNTDYFILPETQRPLQFLPAVTAPHTQEYILFRICKSPQKFIRKQVAFFRLVVQIGQGVRELLKICLIINTD